MSRSNKIEIPFNKFKLLLVFLGSLLFVVAGFYMLESDYVPSRSTMRRDFGFHIFGVRVIGPEVLAWAVILFFGMVAVGMLLKLFVQKQAVIITQKELISNSIGFRTKRIPLDMIYNLDVRKHRGGTMIRVEYYKPKWNDPKTFFERTTYINKNTISFNFDQLFKMLKERVDKNKRS